MFDAVQQQIDNGRNSLVVGRAGTGKSWLLRRLVEHNSAKRILVAAPTGMAAINCEGQTLHGAFHFPVRLDRTRPSVIKRRDEWFKKVKEFNPAWLFDILFIDEISMVRADLFEALEIVLRKHGPKPGKLFGGVQIVVFGDLLQLPPIVGELDVPWFNTPTRWNSEWFFSTRAFRQGDGFELTQLKVNHRQADVAFALVLDRVRLGRQTGDDLSFLNSLRKSAYPPHAVHLYCLKEPVRLHNERELHSLSGRAIKFSAVVDRNWRGDDPVDRTINLKTGARVMLRANLNVANGWVNGTLGTIGEIIEETQQVVVIRDDQEHAVVGVHTWQHDLPKRSGERFVRTANFTQIPLELAWAFTVHKMQGQTVNGPLVLHPEDAFDYGQLYVGLSRVRSSENLFLSGPVSHQYLRPNPKALRFLQLRNIEM